MLCLREAFGTRCVASSPDDGPPLYNGFNNEYLSQREAARRTFIPWFVRYTCLKLKLYVLRVLRAQPGLLGRDDGNPR